MQSYTQDMRDHLDSIEHILDIVDDDKSILEREVKCLREEKLELEDTLGAIKGYNQELSKQIENLKNERSKFAIEADNWRRRYDVAEKHKDELRLEIDKLVQEKSKLENENIGLEEDSKYHLQMADKYRYESIRNRIEADLWKLILEYGLEDVLDKFYIVVPEGVNSWRYVHFLVNKDYDGERPEFDVSQQFSSDRVVFVWYKNREWFDAEAEFEKAVKYARQGPATL